jgi:HSP20 family protein
MQSGTNPFRELERVFDRMGEQFDDAADWWHGDEPISLTQRAPAIDLVDTGDAFTATADLPGFDRDEIDASVSDHTLTITANHSGHSAAEDGRYLRQERHHRSLERSIRLPATADPSDATARLRNGVLTVTMPKREASKDARQLDIDQV